MKILVTGCNGMLGTDLIKILNKENKHEVFGVDIEDLDLTNLEKTQTYIKKISPDCIINCAAFTNVDLCETETLEAFKGNAIIPKFIAIICNELNIKFVHISTDYVFDGNTNLPYKENDLINPLSIYGKSKLAGEQNIINLCSKFFIIRTQWLYGENGKNFVKTMVNLGKSGKDIKVVNDQFGSPTYTIDLCEAIINLIETNNYGIYHITNTGIVSWYEFTRKIFELLNIDLKNLSPCTTKEFPRPAKRPAYSPLENLNYKLCGFKQLRSYDKALEQYIKEEDF